MLIRSLLLGLLLMGLIAGCSRSKPTKQVRPFVPELPPEVANPPSPDKLPRELRSLPANNPRRKYRPRLDLSKAPPLPPDFVLPPLPPGVEWPDEIKQRHQ